MLANWTLHGKPLIGHLLAPDLYAKVVGTWPSTHGVANPIASSLRLEDIEPYELEHINGT